MLAKPFFRFFRAMALLVLFASCSTGISTGDLASETEANDTLSIAGKMQLIRLTPQVYQHVSYLSLADGTLFPCNGLVYVQAGNAVVFDTPPDLPQTQLLVDFLQDKLHLTIKAAVVNHWHNDCTAGLPIFEDLGIPTFGNQQTIAIGREKGDPVPQVGFQESFELTLGDAAIECRFLGAAHTLDNIVCWLPAEKLLFGGCMVKSLDAKGMGNVADADLAAWPETIREIKATFAEAAIIVPGHGAAGNTALLDHTLDLLAKHQEAIK